MGFNSASKELTIIYTWQRTRSWHSWAVNWK